MRGLVRSRAAAGLLLLALTAHAFVAGATHFHSLTQPGAGTAPRLFQNGEGDGNGAPLGADEKQCLLCRLQRNLVSDLQETALVIAAPTVWTFSHQHLHEASARAGTLRLRQGRAPPAIPS